MSDPTNAMSTAKAARLLRIHPKTALVEDVEWLAMFGTAWGEIARRVGLKEAALERRLYRYGRGDLVFANKPRMEWWS